MKAFLVALLAHASMDLVHGRAQAPVSHENSASDGNNVGAVENFEPERVYECDYAEDCPAYNYCYISDYLGASCYSGTSSPQGDCGKLAADGQTVIPDHQRCIDDAKAEVSYNLEDRYVHQRCYQIDNEYRCASAYYMPCYQNYDAQGNAVQGQEYNCPDNFQCTSVAYTGAGLTDVCIPNARDQTNQSSDPNAQAALSEASDAAQPECRTNFDCGFSVLEGQWSYCQEDGTCYREYEK